MQFDRSWSCSGSLIALVPMCNRGQIDPCQKDMSWRIWQKSWGSTFLGVPNISIWQWGRANLQRNWKRLVSHVMTLPRFSANCSAHERRHWWDLVLSKDQWQQPQKLTRLKHIFVFPNFDKAETIIYVTYFCLPIWVQIFIHLSIYFFTSMFMAKFYGYVSFPLLSLPWIRYLEFSKPLPRFDCRTSTTALVPLHVSITPSAVTTCCKPHDQLRNSLLLGYENIAWSGPIASQWQFISIFTFI